MFRESMAVLLIAGTSVALHNSNPREATRPEDPHLRLEGVYEFVSETTSTSEPEQSATLRSSPDWEGQWLFRDGHYSRVLMKVRRDDFFKSKSAWHLGFESSAGSYEVRDQILFLRLAYTLHPFDVGGSDVLRYSFEGDTLTLVRTLLPHVEDLRKGTVTIVLRRVK